MNDDKLEELKEYYGKVARYADGLDRTMGKSGLDIITAYEQSQKEIERLQKTVDDNFVHDYNEEYDTTKLKSDLDTANKRIAEIAELTTTWKLKNAPQVLRKIYDIARSNR